MLGNVFIPYSTFTLTAVLGHQSTNNKLIKKMSNYKYIYTISYGVDIVLVDVRKCLYSIFHPHPDCCAGSSEYQL
jgi:hypothetical protein